MTRYNAAFLGQLAQLVEQRIENPRVRGSIPRLATRIQTASSNGGRFRFQAGVTPGLQLRLISQCGRRAESVLFQP